MKLNKSTVTWLVIIGLILFSGVISALWPTMREGIFGSSGGGSGITLSAPDIEPSDKTITFDSGIPVLGGQTINEYMALLIVAVPVLVLVPAMGIGLLIVFRLLSSTVANTKGDTEFQAKVSDMDKKARATIKEYKTTAPPDPIPDHERTRWIWISSILTVGLLFAYIGAAWSDNFANGNSQLMFSVVFALVGIALGYILIWPRSRASTIVSTSKEGAVPWDMVFIVVTGAVVVGLGMAVMFWVRAQTG